MFKKLVASALFAGFAAGLIAAALQIIFVVPVILEAEKYETGALVHFGGAEPAAAAAVADSADAAGQGAAADLTRNALTMLTTLASYIGFGLLMVAGFAAAGQRGIAVGPRAGLLWGLGGFLALHLLPGAGLAPELPGNAAADLLPRQIWWVATVAASAAGLACLGLGRNWGLWALGAALIALPHLIGAPQPAAFQGVVPPELAAEFVGRAQAVAAAGWVLLGLFAAWFWQREGSPA